MTKWTQWTDSEIYLYCIGIGLATGIVLGAYVWSTGAGIAIGLTFGYIWAEWMKDRRDRRHEQRAGADDQQAQ